MSDRPVRVRIGPSPTGEPHVGTAYIALFNLAFAKKHGGKFILRVEDTDQDRSKPEWEAQIMEGLQWLDLQWDEGPDVGGPFGPYRQSERQDIYVQHANQLLQAGHAYRCFATTEELVARRAEIEAAKGDRSTASRLHRDLDAETAQRYLDEGRPYVIRMKAPLTGTITVKDRLRGEVQFEATQVDDQILLKSDGFPTYHLANVVDDHLMQISHVIRAEEWISSTPKHVLLYDMFGWDKPEFVHMPLLRNKDKSKISKRKNPVSIMDYQRRGFLPKAVLNYLGTLGFTMPEDQDVFELEAFVQAMDFDRIQLGGPVFDLEKLTWMNGKYLREKLNEAEMVQHLRTRVFSDAYLAKIVPLFKERIDVAEQLIDQASYFFVGDIHQDAQAMLPKKQTYKGLREALEKYAARIDAQVDFSPTALEALSREFCEAEGLKAKDLFMALRVVVTGRNASPPLFDVMSVLGRAMVRRRLRGALGVLKVAADTARKQAQAEAKAGAAAQPGEATKKKPKKGAGYGVETVEGIGEVHAATLAGAEVRTTEDLLTRAGTAKGRAELANGTGLSEKLILKWANMADLMRIKGVAGEYAELLEAAGVDTIRELAQRNPENLAETLQKVHADKGLTKKVPHPKGIQMWIERAKVLTPRIEY